MTDAGSPRAESASDSTASEPAPDVDVARRRIQGRGARIRTRATRRAVRRLEAELERDLDPRERRVLHALARKLTGELLRLPLASLDRAADEAVVETTLGLFGDDGSDQDGPGRSSE